MTLPKQRHDGGEGIENDADKIVRENDQVRCGNRDKMEIACAARRIV